MKFITNLAFIIHRHFRCSWVPVFFILFLLHAPTVAHAQNSETETQLNKTAIGYFDQGDLVSAYPIYSQLLSLHSHDANYNYRFGACLLYAKADKTKAIKYLQYAVKHPPVENLAYYYLGRALHLNYRFDEAISNYQKFKENASSSDLKKYPVDYLIEMCNNGKKILATSQELDVLRKQELNFSNFFRAYNLHTNGGSLIAEPEEFKSKLDKQKKVANLMYLTPDKTKGFFASYGNNESNGKDIYMIERKPTGDWGTPVNVGNVINTTFDEDYPVYDAPRNTLYFSSKGHNSMGGYDIFSSVYDDASQSWSQPVNLDFPINTPDDDILLIPDSISQTAFFASTRNSPQGKIDVYKIALHLHPPESTVIAGTVGGTTPEFSIITVRDSATNQVVAVDTTSSQDGSYSFNLSSGKKYTFTVEDSTHKGVSQSVFLAQEEAKLGIIQNIQFDPSGNLQIKNNSAGGVTNNQSSDIAIQYIRNQAQMNVNVDTNSIQTLLAQNKSALTNSNTNTTQNTASANNTSAGTTTTQDGGNNTTNTSTGTNDNNSNNIAQNNINSTNSTPDSVKAATLQNDEQQLNDKASKAIDYASNEMETAQQLQERINNPAENGGNSDSITKWKAESSTATDRGLQAYQLAASYKSGASEKQLELNKIEGSASNGTQVNNQSSDNNNSQPSTAKTNPGDLIRQQAEQVKEDSTQLAGENNETTQEISGLQQQSDQFNTQASQTSDPQQKAALQQQVNDLLKSKEEKQEEVKENNTELQQMHDENVWLNNQAQQADNNSVAATNVTNPSPQLQKDINDYAISNGGDSATEIASNNTNQGNGTVDNGSNVTSTNKTGTTNTVRHSKHFHNKKNGAHQANNIAATNNNTQVGTTDNGTITTNGNNNSNSTTQLNNNSNGNNNIQVGTTDNGNNNSNSTTQSNNNSNGNNNSQITSTDNGTSSTNGNNNSNSTTQLNNNSNGNNNTQITSTDNGTSSNNGNNNSSNSIATSNNYPDSSAYYKTSTGVTADSLAKTFSNTTTQNSIATHAGNNQGASALSTVIYNDTVSLTLDQKAETYFTAATSLSNTAKQIRNQAQAEPDKNKAVVLYSKVDSIGAIVYQLNLKGNQIITDANTRQYIINANQIATITPPPNNSQSDKITTAQSLLTVADNSYKKSLDEQNNANSATSPAAKQNYLELAKKDLTIAIINQERAVYLYFQVDSIQTVGNGSTTNSNNDLTFTYSGFLKKKTASAQNVSIANNSNISTTQNIASTNNTSIANQNTANTQSSNSDNSSNNTNSNASNTNNTQSANANNNIGDVSSINNISADDLITNAISSGSSPIASLPATVNAFKEVSAPVYSVAKPIPKDQALPNGLIFGVQVGAFRNPISQDLFKGFEPIIGMTAPEGYVRYIAGLFRTLAPAKEAQTKIRNIGYPGAFIVAFYNGKRITIKEALARLGNSPIPVANTTNPETNNAQTNGTQQIQLPTQPGDTVYFRGAHQVLMLVGNTIMPSKKSLIDNSSADNIIKDTVAPEAHSVAEVKGLFYTVQVGSFSSRKGFTRLRKIKNLYSWTDPSGTIKYNSGTYSSIVDARAARDIIVANTIVKDAFVAIYYNGNRITSAQAKVLLNQGTVPSSNTSPANFNTPKRDSASSSTNQTNGTAIDSTSFIAASQTRVIFTVRIASFTGQLPSDTVNKILSYSTDGVAVYKEPSGATDYYAGKYPDYAEASILQKKFIKGGFSQSVIEAYYQGKKISLQEAQSITNK